VAKLLWAFAADQFIVDRGGKFSIIGIWENVFAQAFPALHPQLFIVAGWQGTPMASLTNEVRIWVPGGALLTTSGAATLQLGPTGKGISVQQFAPLQLIQPGIYRVEIMLNGALVHKMELTAGVPQVPNA
jgi:hypothetical protein